MGDGLHMMADPNLEHLRDHVEMFMSLIEARARFMTSGEPPSDAAREMVARCQERIVSRRATSQLAADGVFARLELSASEQQVAWMLAAISIDSDARALLPRASGESAPDPTLQAIRVVVYGSAPSTLALSELSTGGRLRRLGVIERTDGTTDVHESRQTWGLSPRVLAALHGDVSSDHASPFMSVRNKIERNDLMASETTFLKIQVALQTRDVVLVSGSLGAGRRTIATAVARTAGIEVLEVDSTRLAKDSATCGVQLRAVARECKLRACVPLLANVDTLDAEPLAMIGNELVAQLEGPILATCGPNRPTLRWGRPTIVIEMGKPTSEQLGALWLRELGQGTQSDAELLATKYPLAPAMIHHAAAASKARAAGRDLTPDDIYAGIRSVLDDKLGQFARRVSITQTWDDIVLPSDQHEAITELIARVRGRRRVYEQWGFGAKVGKGLGVSALFSGPPGTGKTMVAALIARELGLELYQVDLGKVVSKWIGETEKNLGALFDAAEAGHAILLFDEADSLFGKRTDVKSSNDRNANLETNYLLQRLESFTGICLLTSNHESNMDPAFQRRLSLHLRFELPDVEERAMLWRAMLPAAAPVAPDVDVDALARKFVMSGGYIRNATLRAAFVAADTDSPITYAHLERAARCEYEGMGKIV
jgi:AAA+ superfamily predicted ATPase